MNTSSKVISLKWCSPDISTIGLMLTPGESVGTMNWLKPLWRRCGSRGLVLARTTIWWHRCAPLVHTLVPDSTHPPSVRVARAAAAARSEPACGSLIPIAEKYCPAAIFGSIRRRCSSVP